MTKVNFNLRNAVKTVAVLAAVMFFASCEKEESAKQITAFGFAAPPAVGVINEQAKTVAVAVPSGTDVTALTPTITVSTGATVSPASGAAQNFTNPVQYTVTAEDGSTAVYTVTVTAGGIPGVEPQELTSPITVNTTLVDLGLPIDYVFKGSSLLEVRNNATLTIEPGVTIQFTNTSDEGSLYIQDGATIKAIGTAEKHIQFIGRNSSKGCWGTVQVNTNSDNEFKYCDFINGGGGYFGALSMRNIGSSAPRISVQYCNITGSKKYGFDTYGNDFAIDAFDHNRITGGDDAPVYLYNLKMAEKFDLTSDLTGNANDYIVIERNENGVNVTLDETTVPYYIIGSLLINKTLIINEGVTICMHTDNCFSDIDMGKIVVNGTEAKPVKFTRLPGMTYYWGNYGGLRFARNNGSVLNWCIIEYVKSGMAAIELSYEGNITLNNCTIRNNQGIGVGWGSGHSSCVVNHTGTNERFANNAGGNVKLANGTIVNALP